MTGSESCSCIYSKQLDGVAPAKSAVAASADACALAQAQGGVRIAGGSCGKLGALRRDECAHQSHAESPLLPCCNSINARLSHTVHMVTHVQWVFAREWQYWGPRLALAHRLDGSSAGQGQGKGSGLQLKLPNANGWNPGLG